LIIKHTESSRNISILVIFDMLFNNPFCKKEKKPYFYDFFSGLASASSYFLII